MVNRISAKIIADSINEFGDRLTTYILVFPRIVLAEFNTHRMISKNSASSRAIPFKTMVQKVRTEPFIPIAFQKEHKGMQGSEYFEGDDLLHAQSLWIDAAYHASVRAEELSRFGVTKQLANRQLEPYLYHTVICTGTEWENFFALRAHPAAEIHIADLAQKMLDVYNASQPNLLKGGQYHIPFGDQFDKARLMEAYIKVNNIDLNEYSKQFMTHGDMMRNIQSGGYKLRYKIAIARCARVSYLNFEGKDDYLADIKLFHTLTDMGHMSPTEHVGIAMTREQHDAYHISWPHPENPGNVRAIKRGTSGNFKGFIQYRKTIVGENKSDDRVLNKIQK